MTPCRARRRSPRRGARLLASVAVAGLLAGLLAGCGRTGRLETGYAYRAINDTEPERRAYYTDPYSDEAFEASLAAERDEGFGGAGGVGPR